MPLNVGTKSKFQLNVNSAKILKKYKPTNLENNLAALSDIKNVQPYDPALSPGSLFQRLIWRFFAALSSDQGIMRNLGARLQ